MNFLHCCRDKLKNEKGFTLLEMLLVITISSVLTAVFIQLVVELYQNNNFFMLQNSWQLDAYLALDFMAEEIKNSTIIEIINQREIELYTYYNQDYQWLKFSRYQSSGANSLGRSIGSDDPENKDFSRNLALLDKIKDVSFRYVEEDLLKVTLFLEQDQNKITVSRLVNLQ